MKFGAYLRALREARNISKTDLARQLGVSMTYLIDIESGRKKPPSPKRFQQLSDALQLSEDERKKLLQLATIERASDEVKPFLKTVFRDTSIPIETRPEGPKVRKLYLLGSVPAGQIEPAADYVEGTVIVDYSLVGNKDCFALRVKGDCLEDKGIFDRDIVIVAKGLQLENGDIAVVRITDRGEEKLTMKLWHKTDDQVILNPATKSGNQGPIIISNHDGKKVEIIGKVIYAYKDFRRS